MGIWNLSYCSGIERNVTWRCGRRVREAIIIRSVKYFSVAYFSMAIKTRKLYPQHLVLHIQVMHAEFKPEFCRVLCRAMNMMVSRCT